MRLLMVVLTPILLAGCSLFRRDRDEHHYERTPKGYVVEVHDRGSFVSNYLTRSLAFNWLEMRIEEWVIQRKAQYGEARCRLAAGGIYWHLQDDYMIETSASPTGSASGMTIGQAIMVCVFLKTVTATEPEVPAHLKRRQADGSWHYGRLVPGQEIPATAHELDHHLGIHH